MQDMLRVSVQINKTFGTTNPMKERTPMALQIMLRLPNGSTTLRTYENAYALVNPRNNFLEIYRNKMLIAALDRASCLAWEYVATPQQPTSRAAGLLLQTHEG